MSLLSALQFGDSAFPSGGFAFSWGLETALRDGRVGRDDLSGWIEAELLGRWARFDRVALAGAWEADPDWAEIVDAALWSEAMRLRSLEAGAALLTSARRMGLEPLPAAAHLPLAQAAAYRAAGLTLEEALSVSAHQAAQGLASAAVRLNVVGAVAVQGLLRTLRPALERAAAAPAPGTPLSSFAPLSDIAMLRPRADRLFVT
ncbi:MAG: urease accessory protein UreF [Pikeienuella sp.]|uniref:urease accessory protein UreF n=1 Tax=Pikeienuella sp. TaxID=2831957 RepID=UPI003919F10D